MNSEHTRELLENFLLGECDPAQREQISQSLLDDENLDAALREAEADLIDALARRQLSPSRAQAMRRYLQETGQTARLEFAQALAQAVKPRRAYWLEAAAAILLLTGGAWWLHQPVRQPAPVLHATLHLSGEATRGASPAHRFSIPPATQIVDLEIEVAPEPATAYRLRLVAPNGQATFDQSGRPWPQALLRVSVPATAFSANAATIELSATDAAGSTTPVAFYEIRVQR